MSGRRLAVAVSSALVLATGTAGAAALSVASANLTLFTKTVERATCTIDAPSDDASVRESVLDAGSNFGSATTLDVDGQLTARRFSFLRFDLEPCALPAGSWVESATITVTVLSTPGARTYEIHRVSASWSEATVTWNSRPGTALLPTATFTMPAALPAQREIDVTADVDADAANHGWRISDSGTTVLAALGRFGASENTDAALRPQLVVDYAY